MQLTEDLLKKILVDSGLITDKKLKSSFDLAKTKNISPEQALIESGVISEKQLARVLADYFQYHLLDLSKERIDDGVFKLIPEKVARAKGVVAISRENSALRVGMLNPDDFGTKSFLEKKFGLSVVPLLITRSDFDRALINYQPNTEETLQAVLVKFDDKFLTKDVRDNGVIELVEKLLLHAYLNKASDIHIDPGVGVCIIRFRIDGILHDIVEVPMAHMANILTRIKILARLRTDEHRAAQDGKMSFSAENGLILGESLQSKRVDVRVSIMPTVDGENVVMRLLVGDNKQLFLEELGLSALDKQRIESALKVSFGMILVTGPTGSGKTTSLYAILKILNKREISVTTIEDPVEYVVPGVTQIQVNAKTNLTFSNGLRSIVRQDPNVIMVGEIRDQETADIAVNAAMTGHLVLSTLHTNDAATTLPRLLDMGIEPFLVSSTVRLIVAQRLVRKICEKCRTSYEPDERELLLIKEDQILANYYKSKNKRIESARFYRGSGCKICSQTGYVGRIGIFEVMEMTHEIQSLIVQRASNSDINAVARVAGMTSMLEDGMEKVLAGLTTVEEIFRVSAK